MVRSKLRDLVTEKERQVGHRIYNKDIAEAVGLRDNTVSRWMSPEPFQRIETGTALAFCRYLGCKFEDLFYTDYILEESA